MLSLQNLRDVQIPSNIRVPNDKETQTQICTNVLEGLQQTSIKQTNRKTNDQNMDAYSEYYNFLLNHFSPTPTTTENNGPIKEQASQTKKHAREVVPQLPYPFVFTTYKEYIPAHELAIIKKTALVCVINEQYNYLQELRRRKENDPLFQFLKSSHSLNETFTAFINQYKQLKSGEYGLQTKLGSDYKYTVIKRAYQRSQHNEYSKIIRNEQKSILEKMKIKFAATDWKTHHLMGTFTIEDSDYTKPIPTPLNFDKILRTPITKSFDDLFNNGSEEKQKPKKKKNIKIKSAGETRLKRSNESTNTSNLIRCPITNKLIPEDKFERHIQILLTDPAYKQEKEKYKATHKLTNLTYENVYHNIKRVLNLQPSDTKTESKKQRTQ
ncbi:AFR645Wp [Eremothecium gossypii ATCC 10895]|uniref:AFR645Wp n=1 Tax=Eremothecium gossypii (strain ATCC 10895 / CBS 109.51 / FGSC 9923 / NRRL Y-1056) TaxID=284811 RepID=Q752D0_EREGS|nr:AFR645Wp [Eremothecium gossypii ATCC 10895]AAS54017.2 AFR645Wp [Eremothecium gossypii ATCC 10895]